MKKIITTKNFLLLTIFCVPLYLIRMVLFGLPLNVFEILLIVSVLLIYVQKHKVILKQFLLPPKILALSLIFVFFGLIASIFFNHNYATGLGILKSFFIVPLLFSFALYLVLDSTDFLEKIYQSIFFSAALVATIALVYKFFNLVTYDNRLSAFYLSPNYLAMYLSAGLFFAIPFLQGSFFKKTFFSISLCLIIIALYFTFSYGAWLTVLFSFLAISAFTLNNKKVFAILILSVLIFGTLLFFSQRNSQKFSDIFNANPRSSSSSRVMIWKSSLLMIKNNPLIGIGPGNFQKTYLEYQKYFPLYLEWAVPQPHNLYLSFWLQAGLLGFAGFLFLLFYVFSSLWKLLKNKKSAAFAAPLFGFFLYIAMHGLVDTPFWKNDLAFLFWLCLFLMLFLKKNFSKKINNPHNN